MAELPDMDDRTQSFFVPVPGASMAQYTLTDRLGAGGMGDVFLATDNRLKRRVALKFLSGNLAADDQFRARFTREAQSAAALNHPNVVTIYEVGEFEGLVFIAMEYVKGESLTELIGNSRPPLDKALDIACQICDGLSSAHNAGMVHRDIKPANIIIDHDGRVRILDFGLAKAEGDEGLTQAGTALGTANYMSPEQAMGTEADKRSDVFAVGVVLYELLSGIVPFKRGNMPATLHAIVHDAHQRLTSVAPNVPSGLSSIIDRALSKDPVKRFESATQMAQELKAFRGGSLSGAVSGISGVAPAPQAAKVNSLAVLQLRNLGSAEDDFLSYGITEDLIVDLTRLGIVRVTPMRSVLKYADSDAELEEIAKALKVNLILDGSIRKAGDRVRITAQLIDVPNDANLWAERWELTQSELPTIKQALEQGVIRALDVGETMIAKAQIGTAEARDADAYENYLKGKYTFDHKKDISDVSAALGLFRQALEQEPSLLAARAGVAEVLIHQGEFSSARIELDSALASATEKNSKAEQASLLRLTARLHIRQSNWTEAEEYAQKALAITKEAGDLDGEAETLGLLISILQSQASFDKALELFDRVLEISRELEDEQKVAEALKNMGVAYARNGELDQANSLYEEAEEMAAANGDLSLQAACESNMGNVHYFRGELDEALSHYEHSLSTYDRLGDNAGAARQNLNIGLIKLRQNDYEAGLASLDRAAGIFETLGDRSTHALTLVNISQARLTMGEPDTAIEIGERALSIAKEIKHPLSECDANLQIGDAWFCKRDLDKAFSYYHQALEVAENTGMSRTISHALLALAGLHYYRSEYDQSRDAATGAQAIAKELGEKTVVLHSTGYLEAVTARGGLSYAGLRRLGKLRDEARQLGDAQLEIQLSTLYGETLIACGKSQKDHAEGRQILAQAREAARGRCLMAEERRIAEILERNL